MLIFGPVTQVLVVPISAMAFPIFSCSLSQTNFKNHWFFNDILMEIISHQIRTFWNVLGVNNLRAYKDVSYHKYRRCLRPRTSIFGYLICRNRARRRSPPIYWPYCGHEHGCVGCRRILKGIILKEDAEDDFPQNSYQDRLHVSRGLLCIWGSSNENRYPLTTSFSATHPNATHPEATEPLDCSQNKWKANERNRSPSSLAAFE